MSADGKSSTAKVATEAAKALAEAHAAGDTARVRAIVDGLPALRQQRP